MITKKEWWIFLDDYCQIAFDSGHLTYAMKEGNYFLRIPNEEMRIDFSNMIKNYMLAQNQKNIYQNMIISLNGKKFKGFFMNLEDVAFQNGKILNLKERFDGINDQLNYEVFLHQCCSIAIKEMLIDSKNKKLINSFEFVNEKQLSEGIFYISFCGKLF